MRDAVPNGETRRVCQVTLKDDEREQVKRRESRRRRQGLQGVTVGLR